MNTLQLPRDIEKALQLSWDDMHPLTEKYKSEIAEKLSTIERRLKKEFGFTLDTKTFSLPELVTVQVEVYPAS